MWTSNEQGKSWKKVRQLTHDSTLNHTYIRKPVNAQPDFYAFWADGNARKPSVSHLYFTNQKGEHVWRLPEKMDGDFRHTSGSCMVRRICNDAPASKKPVAPIGFEEIGGSAPLRAESKRHWQCATPGNEFARHLPLS